MYINIHLIINLKTFLLPLSSRDSSVIQLVGMYNTFCQVLDEGKEVRAVFCDISKAIDRVCHRGLTAELKQFGICGPLLN